MHLRQVMLGKWRYFPIVVAATLLMIGIAFHYARIQGLSNQASINVHSLPDKSDLGDTGWTSDDDIVLIELSPSTARHALQGFAVYRERFSTTEANEPTAANANTDQIFLAELKKLGFDSFDTWRSTLLTLDYAYGSLIDSERDALAAGASSKGMSDVNTNVVKELLKSETDRALLNTLVDLDE